MKHLFSTISLLALSFFWPLSALGDVLDNTAEWDGISFVSPFGVFNVATYGEVITVPTDHFLTDFTFFVKPDPGKQLSVKGYVYSWDGPHPVGPELYRSKSVLISDDTGFRPYTFDTGSLDLQTGSQYVLFLSVSDLQDFNASTGQGAMAYINTPGNQGGFFYDQSGNNFNSIFAPLWSSLTGDLVFRADFEPAAVPEPKMVLPFGLFATIGLLLARRRKRLSCLRQES